MDFSLKIILEGLFLIAEESEEQKRLLSSSDFSPDEYFDFEALDFLSSQIENGNILLKIANEIEILYAEGEKALKNLNWKQEDEFFGSNSEDVKKWRQKARLLLLELQVHNKELLVDSATFGMNIARIQPK